MPKSLVNPLDRLFAALADGTRRDVIRRLLEEGAATVGALAKAYPMALPSFTQHLDVLEQARLIEKERVGREKHISIRTGGLAPVTNWLASLEQAAPRLELTVEEAGETPTAPTAPAPDVLPRVAALARALAPRVAIIEKALQPPEEGPSAPDSFNPVVYSARRLAASLREAPELAAELREALELFHALEAQLAAADQGGSLEGLKETSLPLGRHVFLWRSHPALRDVLGDPAAVT